MPIPKTPENPELAHYLRRRREELGITQQQMAERITDAGYVMSNGTLSRVEITGAFPALKEPAYAEAIARAYGVSSRKLYRVAGLSQHIDEDSQALDLPPDLADMLQRATPVQIRMITRLVRSVIEEPDDK